MSVKKIGFDLVNQIWLLQKIIYSKVRIKLSRNADILHPKKLISIIYISAENLVLFS